MTQLRWDELAACATVDPEVFFPLADDMRMSVSEIELAKAVCESCPVRGQCLEYALRALPYGIAGGLTPVERREVNAQRRSAEHGRGAA